MTCLLCTHWNVKDTPKEIRNYHAFCDLGKRYEYFPPHHTCGKFKEVPAELAQARRKWDESRK